jgi:hypothetical protein
MDQPVVRAPGFQPKVLKEVKRSHYHSVAKAKVPREYPHDPSLTEDERAERSIAAERAERELTPSELLLIMQEGDDIYLSAKEKKAELCNDSLRHLVVDYFQKEGKKLITKAEINKLAEQLEVLTDKEFEYLQDFAAKNKTPLTPDLMKLIVEQYRAKNKKLNQGLYDTISAKFQYYGAQFVTARSAALGHLMEKIAAPCAGAVVESAKTAAKGVGVMFASVFVRDHILPILFTHVLPSVAGYTMGENATMVNSTGANTTGMDPNATMGMGGGRKKGRKTHKRGKRSGRKGKTHRRR